MHNCFYMFIMVSVPKVFIVYFLIWFSICHSKKQLWNSHVLYIVYQILIECPLWDDYFSRNWRHRNGYDKEIALIEVADKKWVNINPPINVGDLGAQFSWLGTGGTAQLEKCWPYKDNSLSSILRTNNDSKRAGMALCVCNLSSTEGDRWLHGAHWLASLACLVRPGPVRDPVFTNKVDST